MKTKAIRMYGVQDFRLEEFELGQCGEDEIIASVVSDGICMSTYKASRQGEAHKRVPVGIAEHPIIIGHEFCGIIEEVGDRWKDKYSPGEKFVIQPVVNKETSGTIGYSYTEIGGDATYIKIMKEAIEKGCLMKYKGETFIEGSLVEPLCCVVGGFNAMHHYKNKESYEFEMGIKDGGSMVMIAATGPMGFLAIDLAIHGPKRPKKLLVIGRNAMKLARAERLYSVEEAARNGVELCYVNTEGSNDFADTYRSYALGNGFDDAFVFAPDPELVTQAEKMLGYDGCLNFFAGPIDQKFMASINFYNVHYNAIHVVGNSGGNIEDMKQAIRLIEDKKVNVNKIVTHLLGLNMGAEVTLHLPEYDGGKKVIYTHKNYPLTDIDQIASCPDSFHMGLAEILERNDGIWCKEAEDYFLQNALEI